jgi:hypothetical protein
MISVEFKVSSSPAPPDEIEINLDIDGLHSLIGQLELLRSGRTEHVHLMSEAWGGLDLESYAIRQGNSPVHHLKILLHDVLPDATH